MDVNIKGSCLIDVGHDYIEYNDTTNIINLNVEELLVKFKKWLKVADPSVNHNNAREKHLEGSGQWLLEDGRYIKWKEQSNSFMWINGISGCGKTLLCSTIIEDIKAIVQAQDATGLAYFYFDINNTGKRSSRSLISSIALSLTARSNNYFPMDKLHKKHDKLSLPTMDELLTLLKELLECFGQVYVVIDALDECDDDYQKLFDKVIKVFQEWQMPHFHLLVTSRREQDIIINMEELVPSELHLSAELVGSDIISYIHSAVENDVRLKRWSPEIQWDIKNELIGGANGMFRWVACQIEELKHCPNQKVLMETLKSLPKDLESTYDQILQRIDKKQIQFAKVILQWLILAMRPLKVEEIAIVLTFDASTGNFDLNLGLADPDDVVHVCSSLVIKTADNKVQLAHASVKEYFMCKPRKIALSDVQLGHAAIAYCCLSYILQEFEGEHTFIFLEYPAKFWPDHYKLSNKNTALQNLAIKALWDQHGAFQKWKKYNDDLAFDGTLVYNPEQGTFTIPSPLYYTAACGLEDIIETRMKSNEWKSESAQSGTYSRLLEIASQNGHIGVVRLLLDKGANANAQNFSIYGNALQAASQGGHAAISRLLLDSGADVNAQGGYYGNALQAAIQGNHAEIAKFLLDRGADVNAQGGPNGNALQAASLFGHAKIVRLLLDNGADVNAEGEGSIYTSTLEGSGGNALQAASSQGHAEIVGLLLDNGAHVDAQGGYYGNALQAASREGHVGIARLLLERGADVNAQGGYCGGALQAASFFGHTEIARFLLENNADVNAQGGNCGNALQVASYQGHAEIARLLLEKGADVNAQGGYHGNALLAASSTGHAEIARLLLDKGADLNAQGGENRGNALQAASYGGHTEIVMLLLEKNSDVNAQGGYHGAALQAASFWGHAEIVRHLLENGADVNQQGGHYGNALQAASFNGHAEIVRLLLGNGADVNAQGGHYSNALQAASFKCHAETVRHPYGSDDLQTASSEGHAEIARLLLEEGADVNAQGGHYGNALQAALQGQAIEIVMLLLDRGVDVNAQDEYYGSALQTASSRGHAEIVRHLLEKGADVNAQNEYHGSALQCASDGGYAEVVRLLLEEGADVNAQGGCSGNALQVASSRGHAEIVKLLLDNGAKPEKHSFKLVWKRVWQKLHKSKLISKLQNLKS